MSEETGPGLVFVNVDTGISEDAGEDAYVVDRETLSDVDRETLQLAAEWECYLDGPSDVVRRVGVSVAELWAAYQWRRELQRVGVSVTDLWAAWQWRREMETAGILADVEDYVTRLFVEYCGERAATGAK